MAVYDGTTLVDLFRVAVAERGDECAASGPESSFTWNEYASRVDRLASDLRLWGLNRGDRVAIMTDNSPEFHIVDMAVLVVGGVPFSMHSDDAEAKLAANLRTAKPSMLFAERRFADAATRLAADTGINRVVTVDAGIGTGDAADSREVLPVAPNPEDIATLIFTSGTTGEPKAVQLSHRSIVESLRGTDACAPMGEGGRVLSYLPLAHIAERFMSYYSALATGSTVYSITDASTLYDDIVRIRPTRFFGVPRVYEKLADRGRALGVSGTRVAPMLGLDATEYRGVATAPSSDLVLGYFADIGLPVSNIWGMSEAIMCTINPPERLVSGSVGVFLNSCEGRVAADGELLVRGSNVMSGYLGDPERTAEMFDEDGWLHTGDLGRIDDAGYLFIVGRKKDLMITATGKNIAPHVIEGALQDHCALIDRAVVVAEGRRYVTAILAPDENRLRAFAEKHAIEGSLEEWTADSRVLAEVERGVAAANDTLAKAETVRAWSLLSTEWLPGSDELTATMKVRRDVVAFKYADRIDDLYAG